jgi:cyanophycinase
MREYLRLFRRFVCAIPVVAGLICCAPGDIDEDGSTVAFLMSLSRGTLVICGGGDISDDVLEEFFNAAGGEQARIVVITTASSLADSEEVEEELDFWRSQKVARLTVLHTRSRETANDPEFASPLAEATGIWLIGGRQAWLADTYLGTVTEQMIHGVMQRGGVVGGISAGAAVMSTVMIRQGETRPEVGRGFGLLPGTVIDQHFLARNRQERLLGTLQAHPGLVGLGIDEGAAVVVRGGRLSVVGQSDVVACITSTGRPPRVSTLRPGEHANLLQLSQSANKSRKLRVPARLASSEATGSD